MTGGSSTAAHTPGPWFQSHRECPDEMYRTQVYDAAGVAIATLHWYPVSLGRGVTGTARDANARLIAAAPDMLAALTELLDVIAVVDRGWNDGNLTVLQQAIDEAVIDRARAAIATAVGDRPEAAQTSKPT